MIPSHSTESLRGWILLAVLLAFLTPARAAETEAILLLVDASSTGPAREKTQAALRDALKRVPPDAVIGLRWFGHGSHVAVVPQPAGKGAILAKLPALPADSGRDLAAALRGAATDFGPYRQHPALLLLTGGAGADTAADLAEARYLVKLIPSLKVFLVGADPDAAGKSELQQLGDIFRTTPEVTSLDALGSALDRLAPFGWSDPGPLTAAASPVATPSAAPEVRIPADDPSPEPSLAPLPTTAPSIVPPPATVPPPTTAPAPATVPGKAHATVSVATVLGILALGVMFCFHLPGEAPRALLYLMAGGFVAGALCEPVRKLSAATPQASLFREALTFLISGVVVAFVLGAASGSTGALRPSWRQGWRAGAVGAVGALAAFSGPSVLTTWCIFGACAGTACGVAARSFAKAARGLAGGTLGGLAGGAVYGSLSRLLEDGPARAFALAVTSAAAGLVLRVLTPSRQNFPAGALARLVPLSGGSSVHLTSGETLLGTGADTLIPGIGTDPVHALLKRGKGEWFIFDKSTTGTHVNGTRITQRTRLENGCTIGVGTAEFRFELPE